MHVNGGKRQRRRMLIYIAAGPAANLISVPVGVILTNHAFPSLMHSWSSSLAAEFVMISILLFALDLVPLGSSRDGSRIAMLLRSRERARRWISTIAVGGQTRKGTRPKYWRQTWLRAAPSLHDNSVDESSGN